MKWRVGNAAAIQMNEIIANEKSLRGIMLSAGSLFLFPIAVEDYIEDPSVSFQFLVFTMCCLVTNKGGKSPTVLAKMGRRPAPCTTMQLL